MPALSLLLAMAHFVHSSDTAKELVGVLGLDLDKWSYRGKLQGIVHELKLMLE